MEQRTRNPWTVAVFNCQSKTQNPWTAVGGENHENPVRAAIREFVPATRVVATRAKSAENYVWEIDRFGNDVRRPIASSMDCMPPEKFVWEIDRFGKMYVDRSLRQCMVPLVAET